MAFWERSEGIWILLVSLGTRAITSKEWELLVGKGCSSERRKVGWTVSHGTVDNGLEPDQGVVAGRIEQWLNVVQGEEF